MARLPRQHRDLPSMVSVVSNEVADKAGDIGAKAFDVPVGGQRRFRYIVDRSAALLERFAGLRRFDLVPIKLLGNFSSGSFQPHAADVVHVRDDGSNVAAFASRRLARHASAGRFSIR